MENTEHVYVSDERDKMDIDFIYSNLKTLYWATNLSKENLVGRINNSICFGLFAGDRQIGFARVITDYFSMAYLADVFIEEKERGKGLLEAIDGIYSCVPTIKRYQMAARHERYARSI